MEVELGTGAKRGGEGRIIPKNFHSNVTIFPHNFSTLTTKYQACGYSIWISINKNV